MAKRNVASSSKQTQPQAAPVSAIEDSTETATALATRINSSILSLQPNPEDEQDTLRALEERYQALVLATGQITWIARDRSVNAAAGDGRDWRLFTGQNMEATRAGGWRDSVHPDDRARVTAAWSAAVAAKSAYEIEVRVRRYDGEYRWLLVRGVPTLKPDGAVREWVGTATDITTRKQAETALRESETRYRTLFHEVPVAVYSCDADGVIQEFNQRAVALWGREPRRGDVNERYFGSFRLCYPDGRRMPHDECPMARALRGETIGDSDAEVLVERPDGERRNVIAHPQVLKNARGDIIGAINYLDDITERAHADNVLRASEAQQADELADMRKLQRISGQLMREGDLDALYQQILDAAIAIMRSDMGSMQTLDHARNELRLLAWKGFHPASAAFWQWVRVGSESSCGKALERAERVIIPDVETSEFMAGTEDLEYYRLSGIRSAQSTPLVSSSGRLVGMISTHWRTLHQPPEHNLRVFDMLARQAADLIERTQAESAAANLAAIVASTSDAIASKTLDGVITSWNASAEAMFGYTPQEIIGRSVRLLIPPDRQEEEDRILARIRAGDSIEHYETVRLTKEGRPLDVSLSVSPIHSAAGGIIGASKIVRDITERKRTEQLLAEQNSLLELIAAARPLDECLTELTSAVARLQARTRAALLLADVARTRFATIYAADIPPSFSAGLQDAPINDLAIGAYGTAVFSGEPVTCEDIAHDDRWATEWRDMCLAHGILAYHSEPVLGSDGQPLASLMLCFDAPRTPSAWELRIADFGAHIASIAIERDRAAEALRASERRKDEFLGIASHELRTPLTSITANVQMARRVMNASPQTTASASAADTQDSQELPPGALKRVRRLLESTDHQLSRLARLVSDLLDVSRIQSDKLELRSEPCDLLVVVGEAVEGQRVVWPDRRLSLDLSGQASLALVADADRIGQVVTNYLTNALKYSAPDQPVEVRVRVAAGQARVEVCDHGPGLTPEQQALVFESFYRAPGIEQLSGSGAGLGLGLYICKTIIERHNGAVGVESAPGAGSVFWFTLPYHPDETLEA